ncbi:MAG: hypothetical protein ABA06_02270 [Parcubacteria bacterium C7867-001]|nr:MAG: hypothetical protein ABA06_02270 [Parcubacteria bacterium C7867-001]
MTALPPCLARAVEFGELIVSMDLYRELRDAIRKHVSVGDPLPKRLTWEDIKAKPYKLDEARAEKLEAFKRVKALVPYDALRAFLSGADIDVLVSDLSDAFTV